MSTTVDAVSASGTSSASAASTKKTSSGDNLSMDDFFTLLAAQLQYQDPMQPTDNSEFMAQMAQFSTLEQLENLSKTVGLSSAASSIGKYATYTTTDSNGKTTESSGTVSAVDLSSSTPSYLINGSWVAQSNVTMLSEQSGSTDSDAGGTA